MNTATTIDGAATTGSRNDVVLLAARVMLAALFILAGVNKLGGMEGTVGYIAAMGLPLPELVYIGTVALEIGAGLMLAVGFKARFAATALGIFTVLAAVIFHRDFSQQMELTMFLKNLAIAGGMFAVALSGPGRYSLDRG
ncbi:MULTISPECIES: DoxX family protein [Qipengyuania]|uniref:DoxX family protein n=2 Tax=Qipengyuania TaxID=1855416 RepID=A0A9Q3S0Y8_9SPHN|nr:MULTISPECIES: DoxX family protein [Qipengyuania]MBY6128421.1 DoxX family protein [Qipengyuania aquimaris]MBY6218056.1 DoxX family protein [Qipengyuania aquimaris]QZD93042.1 DoxX family protein [Qipengyuania xiapuensis]